jgi:hypothetical protein
MGQSSLPRAWPRRSKRGRLHAQAGSIGAQLAGALQGDRLLVEGAGQYHELVQFDQPFVVPGQCRHLLVFHELAVWLQELEIVHLEGGDSLRHVDSSKLNDSCRTRVPGGIPDASRRARIIRARAPGVGNPAGQTLPVPGPCRHLCNNRASRHNRGSNNEKAVTSFRRRVAARHRCTRSQQLPGLSDSVTVYTDANGIPDHRRGNRARCELRQRVSCMRAIACSRWITCVGSLPERWASCWVERRSAPMWSCAPWGCAGVPCGLAESLPGRKGLGQGLHRRCQCLSSPPGSCRRSTAFWSWVRSSPGRRSTRW